MPWTVIPEPEENKPQPEREIIVPAEVIFEKVENEQDEYVIGDWYWVQFRDNNKSEWEEELVCIIAVGSNYIKVKGPRCGETRIHIENFPKRSRPAPDYKEHINKQISKQQNKVRELLEHAKEITRRLGVTPQTLLTEEERNAPEERAIAVMSDARDPDEYKNALIKLKDEDLPEIFRKVRRANERLADWMGSEVIALNSQIGMMKGAKDQIDGKIFNVSIYAGLQEKVYHFAEGEPAPFHEKLHVMQRKLYMDEECLIGYKTGGMDFGNINAFNDWVAKPENRDRMLPHPRCMAVLQPRRLKKHRESYGCLATAIMNLEFADYDKEKYIYIRNGENLYCIATHLDFPDKTFPDKDIMNLTEPQYAEVSYRDVNLVPERTYDEAWKEYVKENQQYRKQMADFIKWNRANGVKDVTSTFSGDVDKNNPFFDWQKLRSPRFKYAEYDKFDDSNLYFDDIKDYIQKQAEKYNRIALIIQGILDRSEILHPHPKICIWKAEDFNACIKLVYDHDYTLYDGEEPDIEAYLYENNQKIGKGSLVVGQDDFWQRREAERENARRDRNWRDPGEYRPDRVRPYGDPGPGMFVHIEEWKPRSRKAVFRWERERKTYDRWGDNSPIKANITVPAEELFNISAYKPGDYKQFFQDPRTRAKYLKWAPVMLTAEEYHAGNFDININAMKDKLKEGWESDGKGGRTRVTTYKGRQDTEHVSADGGWSRSTSYGDQYEGPEYKEDDDEEE